MYRQGERAYRDCTEGTGTERTATELRRPPGELDVPATKAKFGWHAKCSRVTSAAINSLRAWSGCALQL